VVLLLTLLQDEHGFSDLLTSLGWLTQVLQLLDTLDFETVDCLLSSLHGGDGFSELSLSGRLLGLGRVTRCDGVSLLDGSSVCLLLGVETLATDNLNELSSFLLLDADIHHLDLEQLLEGTNLLVRGLHDGKTVLELVDVLSDLTSVLAEQHLVEVDQLQEGGWSGVVVTSLLGKEVQVGVSDGQVHLGHVLSNGLGKALLWELDVSEEPLGDIDQGSSWPLMEPIEWGTVDDTWEHSCPDSEGIADG
jgi:hypothetical protein